MSAEIPILFYNQGSGYREPVALPIEALAGNLPKPFTEDDARKLIADYDELGRRGLRGALQIIHQRGSSGEAIPGLMPALWVSKHLQRLFIQNPGSSYDGITDRDIAVEVGLDGTMSDADRKKLQQAVTGRVGIFIGGGDGHPGDDQYLEELKALEGAMREGMPMFGECLGHEMFVHILPEQYGSNGVIGGYFEALTTAAAITPAGERHPIFSRLGTRFVTTVGNEYHGDFCEPDSDVRPGGSVLARNAGTNDPVAFAIDAETKGQLVSFQYHPYHPIAVPSGGKDHTIHPSGKKGSFAGELVIPANRAHPLQVELAQYLLDNFEVLREEYGLSEERLKPLFHPGITAKNLGIDFYGPVFQFFADQRLDKVEEK